jgi:putative ABC transport system permease protein
VLGVVGGALGVARGWGASRVLQETNGYPLLISSRTVAVAVSVASATGLVFGYFPARHAASLDPIDALRSE